MCLRFTSELSYDMSAYDAVVFDMDGVLLDVGKGPVDSLLEQMVDGALTAHGIREDDEGYQELYDTLLGFHNGTFSTYDERQEAFDRVSDLSTGHGVDHAELWETKQGLSIDIQKQQIRDGERHYYDDVAVIDDLADTVSLGVMSNNNDAFVRYVTTRSDLARDVIAEDTLHTYLDACYGIGNSIDEDRYRKPEPDLLETAVSDLSAENPLYVGDSRCDVAAASRAGIDAAFIRRPHRIGYDLDGHEPDVEIDSLDELPSLVEDEQQ